jgi:uncharacterized protein
VTTRISLRGVAALFVARQQLDRPRARRLTARSLVGFAESTGGIQLDSINVVERAHHLTLWSRFGPYDRRALERLVYRRRVLFEYWAHAACLIASTDFPHWRRAMLDYRLRHRGWSGWLQKNRAVVRAVESALRAGGPLGNADFEHQRPPGQRGGWWNWKPASHALDYLWMTGRTLVHSRAHFQKRFDLAERVMPAVLAAATIDAAEFRRWHLRRSLRAMGAATETDLRMYLTFPRLKARARRRALDELLRAGEVVEVAVEGDGAAPNRSRGGGASRARWYALAADLPALEAAARSRRPARGTTLLSPFDSLLWHRERVRRLFGFDYTLEVYTPGPRRRHGYYVLPVFHDGQLIGRVDVKTHRAESLLELKSVHFEDWFAAGTPPPAARWGAVDRDAALAGVAEAIGSLAAFVGARRVRLRRVLPGSLAAPLRRNLDRTPPIPRASLSQPEIGDRVNDRGA